jgi:Calcineurin-like phosphoesterase
MMPVARRTRIALVVAVAWACLASCTSGQGAERTTSQGSAATSALPGVSPAPVARSALVVAAGDVCGERPDSCAATADLVRSLHPDAVLTLGDNQYPAGTLSEYRSSYDHAWGAFRAITFPVAGNHDWETPDAEGFKRYFGVSSVRSTFRIGKWRLYALDATCAKDGGCGPGSPGDRWLEKELASHSDRCILAYWHQPRFSSGTVHGSDAALAPFWRLLIAAGADLVLNGHEHNYERFARQDADGHASAAGMVEIVAGTGGFKEGSYPFGPPIPNSMVRLNGLGVVALRLSSRGWTESFVRPDGTIADRSSGSC